MAHACGSPRAIGRSPAGASEGEEAVSAGEAAAATARAVAEVDSILVRFYARLPVGPAYGAAEAPADYGPFWSEFLEKEDDQPLVEAFLAIFAKKIRRPDVDSILQRSLSTKGIPILESKSDNANGQLGLAECEGGRPVIWYAQRPDKKISALAMVFFREHEFAHHKLGHVVCSPGKPPKYLRGPAIELAADCEAAATLDSFPVGPRVVDHAAGTLRHMFGGGGGTHPAARERADTLYSVRCSKP